MLLTVKEQETTNDISTLPITGTSMESFSSNNKISNNSVSVKHKTGLKESLVETFD